MRSHALRGPVRFWTATALTFSLALGAGAAVAGHQTASWTDVQGMRWFADGSPAEGSSILTRTEGMVVLVIEAAQLVPGDAHTIWWVVFNNPSACTEPCNEDDIFNPDGTLNGPQIEAAMVGIGNATGNVARGDGTTEFGGRLVVGDATGAHQVLIPAGFQGPGILVANGFDAEVHLVVQTHGNARGKSKLWEQLSLVEAHCTPTCADVQFAIHLPGA